jgi:SMI1/KNR4 family protein SUKH-1
MDAKEYHGLNALAALRSKLDATSHMQVIQEGGYCWNAHFVFRSSATTEALENMKGQLQVPLPKAYEEFLLYSNGALLYHDDVYGQWGFRCYGTEEFLAANAKRQAPYGKDWPHPYLIFAESLGDADVLILDTAKLTKEGRDCPVIDGDSGYLPQKWTPITRSFDDWLDRLVVAQGTKYWRWY